MKKLIRHISILTLLLTGNLLIHYSVIAQPADTSEYSTIKDYYKEYKLIPQLYIKRTGKKKKVRVREGALVNCQLMDFSYTGISYLKIIADEGLYLAPLEMKTDTVHTRRSKEAEVVVLTSDTIVFVRYEDILTFSFRNKVINQNDGAGLLLFIGSELIFAPLIITPLIYGSVENVPSNLIKGFVTAGAPFIVGGVIWKILLRKFRSYPMQEYDFVLMKKTD